MNTERQNPQQDYDEASRTSLEEAGTDEADTVPGRSGSGSPHPEPNPTGNVGISDYSVGDDPDRG
ncbi:hypothetical protein SK571_15640 [Lentzea sp. BCCO 10_0798]|uniref:Uncharacterized protein n=1 Tax=Lentzea kristufekii TaxID=3095430 RepID=A0ABU4TRI5_9PSEU|nr:hypothetical protein [Lentzea sp. BCCO 10_0798]MDX8050820.1 hypothetical protein [Lentzea sp. BCCO 10_0798]